MRAVAVMFAAAIHYCAVIAGTVYLTVHGHPIVAVLMMIVGFCVSFTSGPKSEVKNP